MECLDLGLVALQRAHRVAQQYGSEYGCEGSTGF